MQKTFSMLICTCLAAALFWPGLLNAAEADLLQRKKTLQTAPSKKKAPQPKTEKQSPGKIPKKPAPKPDLQVTRIWLDPDCRVKVRIENQGKGPIQTADFMRSKLEIRINHKTLTYSLARPSAKGPAVDPSGRLKRPGAGITFVPGLTLTQKSRVRAEVDPGGAVAESNEKNNRLKKMFARVKCAPPQRGHEKTPSASRRKRPSVQSPVKSVLKPDLQVTRVWLGQDCRIKVRIENQGKGPIQTADFLKGELEIKVNNKTTTYSLARRSAKGPAVDPSGRLKRPGAGITFVPGLTLTQRSRVRAEVDPGGAVAESNEKNNRLKKMFARVNCTPSEGGKITASQGIAPNQADLRLAKLWLNRDCRLMLQVTNQGPAGLSASEQKKLRVQVRYGQKTRDFSLDEVDPRGELGKAGGTAKFATGINLQNVKEVQVRAKVEAAAQEKNRADNRLAQVLKPSCGQEPQAVQPAQARLPGDQEEPLPMRGRSVLEETTNGSLPEGGDKLLDRGIRIESPRNHDQFYAGETITVAYWSSRGLEPGEIHFVLLRVTGRDPLGGVEEIASISVPYDPSERGGPAHTVNLTPPSEAATSGAFFYIKATHSESEAYGVSDRFTIRKQGRGINFVQPNEDDWVQPGERLQVHYWFQDRVAPGLIVFMLRRTGLPLWL